MPAHPEFPLPCSDRTCCNMPPTTPRRVMLSQPNPVTGVRLLLTPTLTLDPLAGQGWDFIVVGRVGA